jgi:DNA-binding PadR family transcriptional regulator
MSYEHYIFKGCGGHWLWGMAGRRGHHRFGRGGPGFMGRRGGGFPGAGRRLDSNDLQLVILALLAERPSHGYELIRALEERSGGFYTPSPGVIYPALTFLDETGQALAEQDGTRKLYRITSEGEARLAGNRATVDAILEALARIGNRMDQVREAFAGANELDDDHPSDELHRARRALKHALYRKRGSDPAEAQRIARILDRATAEILGA